MVDPRTESVELVSSRYDEWRVAFEAERRRLAEVLAARELVAACERIVHVGSTAVPDLPAKDIVDIDVVVTDGAVGPVSRAIASDLGGDRFENTDAWHPVFRRAEGQRFNVHVFAVSSEKWKTSVVTKSVLRARPELRREYASLKTELAAEHDDVDEYSRGKTAFIETVLRTASEAEDLSFDFEVPDGSSG